jgi:hypothetical protein
VTPVFTLVNHGTTTLVSCTVNYQLNGGSTNSIPWTGSLNTNQTATINLPQLTAANGANTLTITITNVNGNANDDVSNNNSSTFSFNAISGAASGFTVSIILDDYPEETSWDIQDNSGNIIASGSGYTGGTVSADVCVATGCYEFTLYDEFGDGICCAYGTGSYEVINSNGATVAQGGEFNDTETTTICTTTVGLTETNASTVVLYPNPANDQVRIQANNNIVELRVLDAFGRMITTIANAGMITTLSTQHMADGVYHITINTADGNAHQTLVVRH